MIRLKFRVFTTTLLMLVAIFFAASTFADSGVVKVRAEKNQIVVTIKSESAPLEIFEIAPNENGISPEAKPLGTLSKTGKRTITFPRFDETKRDRIYSGFVAAQNRNQTGAIRFVEEWKNVSKNQEAYPRTRSKKGLQVQMVDDAIALGVKHAALNWNIGNMITLHPKADDLPWQMDGRTFFFRRSYVEGMGNQVKTLSDAGINVTLILLAYKSSDAELNRVLLHPDYDPACPQNLSAFNTVSDEGLAWYKASMEFLAARFSEKDYPHGRVANYIVGNEVNSHWSWCNMGRVSMEKFAEDYLRAVRVCDTAVRKFSSSARVFVSLDHFWTMRGLGLEETQGFPGRDFLECFNRLSKQSGDFAWNVAYHPYPENLFKCRTWKDESALPTENTPRITFKNLEVLPRFLRKPEMRFNGQQRHVILSEQGFHSLDTPEGEQWQAAAYCYAYYKTANMDGIDAFILHRHVDHGAEGGLRLGLWRRNEKSASMAEPAGKKPIYEVFRAADTPEWKKAFEFALPIIGIKSWDEILPAK